MPKNQDAETVPPRKGQDQKEERLEVLGGGTAAVVPQLNEELGLQGREAWVAAAIAHCEEYYTRLGVHRTPEAFWKGALEKTLEELYDARANYDAALNAMGDEDYLGAFR